MFLGETLEEEAFVMKNPNNIFIELSYDKFTELRKKGLVGLTIDNMGSINAAMLGISKSKGDVTCFYLAWLTLIGGIIASFVIHWAFFIVGFATFIIFSKASKNIRNRALVDACINSADTYEFCTKKKWVYVTTNNPIVINEFNSENNAIKFDHSERKVLTEQETKDRPSGINSLLNKLDQVDNGNFNEETDEECDEYIKYVEQRLINSNLKETIRLYNSNASFENVTKEFVIECFYSDLDRDACANCLLSIVSRSEGKASDAIHHIILDKEWVSEIFSKDEIEEFNDTFKYSPDEKDFHHYFDIKYEEIFKFFTDLDLLETEIERKVAAVRFVYLATCCSTPELRDNSFAASTAYRILSITKEKWKSSGIEYDKNGNAAFVDYCPHMSLNS